jgi:uncharacterized repeat protein (TIGR01451 family)
MTTLLVLSLSITGPGAGWLGSSASASEVEAPTPGIHVVASDAAGVVLELYTPDFEVEPVTADGITCDRLSAADYATGDQAGWPQLPVRGAMLGIPADARVSLEVLSTEAELLPRRYDLCPVPSPVVEADLTGQVHTEGYDLARDGEAYAIDGFAPASPAELVSTGFIRSQRVAEVRFHPFQYNPTSGRLNHLKRIRVRLDFGRERLYAADTAGQPVDEGAFEETLGNVLLNYDGARQWRTRPVATVAQADRASAPTSPSYKVFVDQDGIYEIGYADLLAASVDAATLDALDPRSFQLHNRGQQVAIHVAGEADASFDPGDHILFYGQQEDTRYTDTNVYWLTWGGAEGLRMATLDGTPEQIAAIPTSYANTHHVEEDESYWSKYPSGPDEDHWYWTYAYANGAPTSVSLDTILSHVATEPFSATVRGLLWGYDAAPDHHTQVHLNGHLIDEATWATQMEYAFETSVPGSYLVEGTNTISVTAGLNYSRDIVLINWFEIDCRAAYVAEGDELFFDGDQAGTWTYQVAGFGTDTLDVFDVTEPTSTTRILSPTIEGSGLYTLTFQHAISEEHTYVALSPAQRLAPAGIALDAASDLRSTANGADYIIITHGDFYTDVLPLATHRAGQGLRTALVDVQDVYDEFSDGIFDPQAIHDFLSYAYANWQSPAPAYVLLVGDGNYDFKDHLGRGEPNYIPPYLSRVDNFIGESAADNRYVCVSGGDAFPDMHLGRLPVQTSAEAAVVVDKILSYEQSPPAGEWNQKTLFVADDPELPDNDFYAYSDAVAGHYVPAPYTAQKVYYLTPPYTSSAAAKAAVIAAINEGRLIVNYVGHGSTQRWAGGDLLSIGDVPSLTNAGRLPFVVPMTCLEGYYIHPSDAARDRSSLGESLVRHAGGGAIASWSPTGEGYAAGHDYLNRGLLEALLFDDVTRLGPATTQGKLYLYSHTGGHRDLLDAYVLFGDPALTLHTLEADLSIAPASGFPGPVHAGQAVTYTLTYTNAGPATAHNVAITHALPAALVSATVTSSGAAIAQRPGARFSWDVADLAAGEGGVITVTASVSPTYLADALPITATISTSAAESSLADNTAGAAIPVMVYRYYVPFAAVAGTE